MNYRNISRRFGVSVTVAAVISACSDVSFSPDPNNEQGLNSGRSMSESFTQGLFDNKLDIIFVVDNSASMSEEQQKMGQRIGSFLSTLYDVDWRIAVTTTDVSDGPYGIKGDFLNFVGTNSHVLTKNTPNYEQAFNDTVVRQESILCGVDYPCASGDEQALAATIMSINKRSSTNSGFFRDGADLGVLYLSDEDEKSAGGPSATTPQAVLQTFQSVWGDTKDLYAYGMIIEPGDVSCMSMQTNGGSYGTFVDSFAQMTGGLTGSICADDYGPTLGQLADNVRKLLNYVLVKFVPVADSIQVTFNPPHVTTWSLKGRKIFFADPPPKDTVITIDYIVK